MTERLQQILQTVRRDPSCSVLSRIDLNEVMRDIAAPGRIWPRDKWKLTLTSEFASEPLWIEGDVSHLQQAVENLIFNARDATFEMRGALREKARRANAMETEIRQHSSTRPAARLGRARTSRVDDARCSKWKTTASA